MEIIVLKKKNNKFTPFDMENLGDYTLHDSIQVEDDVYISEFIDINYNPKQTSHNYTSGSTASTISAHWYSVIITRDDLLLYFISCDNTEFGKLKSMLRRQTINDIIK